MSEPGWCVECYKSAEIFSSVRGQKKRLSRHHFNIHLTLMPKVIGFYTSFYSSGLAPQNAAQLSVSDFFSYCLIFSLLWFPESALLLFVS